jgi:hypothetical protein
MAFGKVQAKRLLNVVRALHEDPDPENFTMLCALGHYAARRDLQRSFRIAVDEDAAILTSSGQFVWIDDECVLEHFGLAAEEASELFDIWGCGGSTGTFNEETHELEGRRCISSPKVAARYIERFVRRKCKAAGIAVPA